MDLGEDPVIGVVDWRIPLVSVSLIWQEVEVLLLIDTDLIKPLHGPRHDRILSVLLESMLEDGWNGRPLLVIERADDYQAWTGSHRLEAARMAGIEEIPCYILQEADLLRCGHDALFGHVDDSDRLEILRDVGDEGAFHLMAQEGRVD